MPAPQIDIVARLRETAATGSRSDRRIAAEILADPDFAPHVAIARLAARAEVSEPTVTRFCRSLGCAGSREFKLRRLSSEVPSVIDAVNTARLYGATATAIAVTAPSSSLAAVASLVLPFRVDEGTDIFRPSPARYALPVLTDMLAMAVAERIGAPAIERMRRIRHHQGFGKRDATHLPLGD